MKLHEYTYVKTKIQFEFKNFFFWKIYFFVFKSNWLKKKTKQIRASNWTKFMFHLFCSVENLHMILQAPLEAVTI